jgi:hypothetical protein
LLSLFAISKSISATGAIAMSSINGVGGIGSLSTLFSTKKPAAATTPFGDLLSQQGFSIGTASASPVAKLTAVDSSAATGSATDEFQKYMQMTPAEKIRYNMLQEMGLTEDSVKALPPQEQQKIETAIADRIKQELGANANANGPQSSQGLAAGLFQSIQALQSTAANNAARSSVDTYS